MSSCSGPDCKHSSHFDENGKRIPELTTIPRTVTEWRPTPEKLTKNQLRAKRRKGIPGY